MPTPRHFNSPSCDRTSTMPSINLNGIVAIDENDLQTNSDRHHGDMQDLQDILPAALWPTVETLTTSFSCYNKYQLYPGRVLIGHIDDEPIWAHLWKINFDGGTSLEYFIGESNNTVKAGEDFTSVDFQKWCLLLACRKTAIGSKGWEERVKAMVKLVMLCKGHYDGSASRINMVLSTIRLNQERGHSVFGNVSEPLRVEQESEDGMTESSATPVTKRNAKPKGKQGEIRKRTHPYNYEGLIQKLREVLPTNQWFRVDACQSLPDRYHEGKVLIGNLRHKDGSNVSPGIIWARVQQRRKHDERSSRVAYFDENEVKGFFCGAGGIDLTQFDFNAPFQLLVTKDSNKVARSNFRKRVSACVRAALLAARPGIGNEFNGAGFVLSDIVTTIQNNLQQKDKHNASPNQVTPKETGADPTFLPDCTTTPPRDEMSNRRSPHTVATGSQDSCEFTSRDVESLGYSGNEQTVSSVYRLSETDQNGETSSHLGKRRLSSSTNGDLVARSPLANSDSMTHYAEHNKRRKTAKVSVLTQSTIQTLFIEPITSQDNDMSTLQERVAAQDEQIIILKNQVADLEEDCATLELELDVKTEEMCRATNKSNERIQDLIAGNDRLNRVQDNTLQVSSPDTHQETGDREELIQQLRVENDRLKEKSNKQIEALMVVKRDKDILDQHQVNYHDSIKNLKSKHDPLMRYMEDNSGQVQAWLLQWKQKELRKDGHKDPEGAAKAWFGETFCYPMD